jgi:hypothetical protein
MTAYTGLNADLVSAVIPNLSAIDVIAARRLSRTHTNPPPAASTPPPTEIRISGGK